MSKKFLQVSSVLALINLSLFSLSAKAMNQLDLEEKKSHTIKEVYKNRLVKQGYQRKFCDKELYPQGKSEVAKCGQLYQKQNEQRIVICYDCYISSVYNPDICSSDRNAYSTTFHTSFKGTLENFPRFLFESAGSDLREMLLKEREMFKMGFRAIYHVCNPGHHIYRNEGNKYVSPLFLYQLFGVLDSLDKGLDITSPEFIPCIPRYNTAAFNKVPNRESFIKEIQSTNDCHLDVSNTGLVGVAALGGCYHNEHGGIVFSRYHTPQPVRGVPHPPEIIMNALKSSKIALPSTEIKNVANDLLKLAEDFHVVNSALLQIFLSEDSFLNHVCFSKNEGKEIRPIDRKAIEDGEYLKPGIQLNVYLPTSLVTNREKCNIHLYTRCGTDNTPISQKLLTEFRNKVLDTIYKYSQ